MTLSFKPVHTEAEIAHLADMADAIWHEYWPDIIGSEQTDYMVQMFQSVDAITRDIEQHNYRYWMLIDEDGNEVGFTGGATEQLTGDADHDAAITHSQVVNEAWPQRFFISKVYLLADARGKHYASRVMDFYEQLCRDEGLPVLYLTVNRENELGVRAYKGRGFEVVDEVDADIGHGYLMTDYIMVKIVRTTE